MNHSLALILTLLLAFFLWWRFSSPVYPQAKIKLDEHILTVEIASTLRQKARGLSYRQSLPADHGMLFTYTTSTQPGFWMKGMRFPLDLIWLNHNRIIHLTENATPGSFWSGQIFYPPEPVTAVLEVPAGTAARLSLTTSTSFAFITKS